MSDVSDVSDVSDAARSADRLDVKSQRRKSSSMRRRFASRECA
jgi:hypothetical protein